MTDIGDDCIEREAGFQNNATYLAPWSSFTKNSRIKSFCTYAREDCSIRVKVFRNDGINFIYIGGSELTSVVTGSNRIQLNIEVQSGDFIGFYTTDGTDGNGASSGTFGTKTYYSKDGDVTSNTLISDWVDGGEVAEAFSLKASTEDLVKSHTKLGKTLTKSSRQKQR